MASRWVLLDDTTRSRDAQNRGARLELGGHVHCSLSKIEKSLAVRDSLHRALHTSAESCDCDEYGFGRNGKALVGWWGNDTRAAISKPVAAMSGSLVPRRN
jgi:hypothetical protein